MNTALRYPPFFRQNGIRTPGCKHIISRSGFIYVLVAAIALSFVGCRSAEPVRSPENELDTVERLSHGQLARRAEVLRLLSSDDRQVRERSAIELLSMGDGESWRAIKDKITGPAAPEVKVDILNAIAFRGDRRAFNIVLKALGAPHREVREAAAKALENYTRPEEIETIIKYATSRDLTARELKLIYRTMGESIFVKATPVLIGGLESDNEEIKETAWESLRLIWDRNLPPSPEPWLRLWELNQNRSRSDILEERLKAAELSLNALRQRKRDMQSELEEFSRLAMSEERKNPQALLDALAGSNPRVVEYAAFTLRGMSEEDLEELNLDERSVYESLRSVLRDSRAPVDVYIAELIAKLRGTHRKDLILDAFQLPSPEVLTAAVSAVRDEPSPEIVGNLELLLQHANPKVREAAANALSRSDEESTVAALRNALNDEEANVRWFAVESLRKLGATSAMPELVELLREDSSSLVREISASTLGDFAQPAAFPPLRRALEDDNRRVREQVVRALIALAEEHPDSTLAIGEALVEKGFTEGVENILKSASEEADEDESPELLAQVLKLKMKLADELLRQEAYSRAAGQYQALLEVPEYASEARGKLISSYLKSERGDRLLDDYQKWLETEESDLREELIRESVSVLEMLVNADMKETAASLADIIKNAAEESDPALEDVLEEIDELM